MTQVTKVARQRNGLFGRTVGNHQQGRFFIQQGFDNATCSAAGPNQQQPFTCECSTVIDSQIANQSRAIGVVTEVIAGFVQHQCIDCARAFRPVTAPAYQCPGLLFERHGDVQSLAAL